METDVYFIQWLEEIAPNKTPTTELTPFEYGVLAGYRILVEQIKIKLEVKEDK